MLPISYQLLLKYRDRPYTSPVYIPEGALLLNIAGILKEDDDHI